MKKSLLIVLSILLSANLFAQIPSKATCTDPAVSISILNVTQSTFTVSFTPNEECDHYKYVAVTDDEINEWLPSYATIEGMINAWGISSIGSDLYTWVNMNPNTTYKIMVLAFDSRGSAYPSTYTEVTTLSVGGSGTAAISVSVSEITAHSVRMTCIANDETSRFYDGIVTVDFFNEVGIDTVKSIIASSPNNLHFISDDWTWMNLNANTDYYAIAFGQNADGEWGSDSLVPFCTLNNVGTTVLDAPTIILYPMPSNGDFNLSGKITGSSAQIFNMNGQLVGDYKIDSDNTHISTGLPAGNYIVRVLNAEGKTLGHKKIIIQ